MNLYQYCLSSPAAGTDPTGLFDWEKFEKGIWDAGEAESLFLASMPIAGLGSLGQADTQGMVNAGADFLCGLLTAAAEGITEDPIFGKLRDYVRSTQGLANTGIMVVGAFSMANSLRGAAKGPSARTAASSNLAQQKTGDLSAAAQRAGRAVGPGKGSAYGTKVHSQFAKEVKALGRKDLTPEVSYLEGKPALWGTPGSVRVDVVHGPLDAPTAISDLKTGSAKLTQARVEQIQSHIPGGSSVPVREVRL